jgi:hypothetical protein
MNITKKDASLERAVSAFYKKMSNMRRSIEE